MRYQAKYKAEKRKELLDIIGKVAKSQGFANTGVDSFMKAADMTSGAFYSHFSSKNNLFEALITAEVEQSIGRWQANPHHEAKAWIEFEIQRYLSLDHVKNIDRGCVIPALASEVARADDQIRLNFQNELMRGHALFADTLKDKDQAWAILCQMVGSILLARSVFDDTLKLSIIESSKQMLFQMLNIDQLK